MNFDLTSIFPDLEALTPEGRWSMLQDWLSKNPEYRKRAERWSTESVDQVFSEIRNLAIDEYGAFAAFMLDSAAVKPKLLLAIEVLQACYRDRANNQTEKEIKNVRMRMDNGRDKKRARRANAKAKRADEA